MRLWVRSGGQINLSFGFSSAVGSASDTSNDKVLYQPINPVAWHSDFSEKGCKKKGNASRSSHLHCRIPYVRVRYPRPGWRILTHSLSRYETNPVCAEHPCLLGSTNPCPTCCSHETLLHIGLQSSHLNICYDHQDLHQELIHSGLRQELHSKPPCPPTHCCTV